MNEVQKPNERNLSIVEKLAMVGERVPMIKEDPEVSLKVIFKGLVKTYAYLGHRNIFKGDKVQLQAAKLTINEIASQILEGFRNNKKYRRITDLDFNAIIEKGCASGLTEIKTVSPRAIFEWSDEFLKLYLEQIQRKRIEYQELKQHNPKTENERVRNNNLEGVKALIDYCKEEKTSPYSDLKQFHGYWLAKICERYASTLDIDFINTFSKRKDLYQKASQQAEKVKIPNATLNQVKSKTAKIYSYLLVDEFKERVEFEGSEEYERLMNEAINKFHDEKK